MKYEYEVVKFPGDLPLGPPQLTEWLNKFGEQGWQYIECINGYAIFKRQAL